MEVEEEKTSSSFVDGSLNVTEVVLDPIAKFVELSWPISIIVIPLLIVLFGPILILIGLYDHGIRKIKRRKDSENKAIKSRCNEEIRQIKGKLSADTLPLKKAISLVYEQFTMLQGD